MEEQIAQIVWVEDRLVTPVPRLRLAKISDTIEHGWSDLFVSSYTTNSNSSSNMNTFQMGRCFSICCRLSNSSCSHTPQMGRCVYV